MKRALVTAAAIVALLLVGCGGTTISMPPAGQGGSGGGSANGGGADGSGSTTGDQGSGLTRAEVAGDWLGPAPGDTGGCGTAYSEWLLQTDGAYSVNDNSESCGGFTVEGSYSAEGGELAFHPTASTCPDCAIGDFSVTVSMSGANAMRMCDVPADGRCYTYYRQST